jgi:hypothetical protein
MQRTRIEFNSGYLSALDNSTEIDLSLTEWECAVLLQAAHFLLERRHWNDMNDAEWGDMWLDVSVAISKLNTL